MAKIYRYNNKAGVKGYNGKELVKIPMNEAGDRSTETRHVFLMIYQAISIKTNDDSIQAFRLVTAIDEAEGNEFLEIGEGVYDWLIKKMPEKDQQGFEVLPRLFRHNGSFVYEFIKTGYEKPHQPAPKAEGKKTKDAETAKESAEPQPEA